MRCIFLRVLQENCRIERDVQFSKETAALFAEMSQNEEDIYIIRKKHIPYFGTVCINI